MRRELWIVVLAALVAGVGAYVYYFAWDRELLATEDVNRYSVGYEGRNISEFETFEGPDAPVPLEDILREVNDATLTEESVEPVDGELLVILLRDDGLQYHLFGGADDLVGISEGDRSYVGALRSPELAGMLAELTAAVPPPE